MGGIFSGSKPKVPDMPPPPAPPPVPTMDDARSKQQQQDAINARRGRAASILTGSSGALSTPNVGTKTLLGG